MVSPRLVICCGVVEVVVFGGTVTELPEVITCVVISEVVTVRLVVEGFVVVTVVS